MLRVLANIIWRQFSFKAQYIQQAPSWFSAALFHLFIYLFGFSPIHSWGALGLCELCKDPGEHHGGKASLDVTMGAHLSSVLSLQGQGLRAREGGTFTLAQRGLGKENR